MAFQPGQSGNPTGRRKDKPWRDALNLALNRVIEGDPAGRKKLQAVADRVVESAIAGDMRAAEEIGNRLDGKVPQALIGDGDEDPINILAKIERVIVRAGEPNSDDPNG